MNISTNLRQFWDVFLTDILLFSLDADRRLAGGGAQHAVPARPPGGCRAPTPAVRVERCPGRMGLPLGQVRHLWPWPTSEGHSRARVRLVPHSDHAGLLTLNFALCWKHDDELKWWWNWWQIMAEEKAQRLTSLPNQKKNSIPTFWQFLPDRFQTETLI